MLRLASRLAPLLVILLLAAACAKPRLLPAPEVEYGDCRAVLEPGTVCVLDDTRQLRLWVGVRSASAVELCVDGRKVEVVGEPVREGWRFALNLADDSRSVEVRTAGREPWSLGVAGPQSEPPADSRDVQRELRMRARAIDAVMRDRDLAAMRQMLAALERDLPAQASEQTRYNLHYYRGMLAEREGDYRSALQEMQQAIAIAERVKDDLFRWFAEVELATMLRGIGRSREAARLFEQLREVPAGATTCDEAQALNNQAWSELLAREAGERIADPAPLLEQALAEYSHCEQATVADRVDMLTNLAFAHLQEGRLPTAKELLVRASALEKEPPLARQLWWLDLEGRIALRERQPTAALALFADLEKLAAQTTSSDGRLRALWGKAQSQRALGAPAAALATLVTAEELLDEQSLQVPMHEGREKFIAARKSIVDLHLELLLEEGRNAEALTAAREARSRILRQLVQGDRLAALPAERRARRAQLLTDYQKRREALEVRAAAEWKVPADQRSNEQADWHEEAQAAQRLLDEAFLVLGEARVGRQELPPARPGELILAYHPLAGGWVGFAADGRQVEARRFDVPPELLERHAELAARLLWPFRAAIERAQRLRVLASGPLEQVDFHALPFAGEVLLTGRPVVYGLDLPRPATPPSAARGRKALLVGDPRGDLPGAADEVRAVEPLLRSARQPWTVNELRATRASDVEVRAHLAGTDLFHYAGHGSFAGLGGWESRLLLAGESELTLGDILALQAPPRWVMLSGCDTGRSAAETPVASLGLAHAFLLAGSRAVVASTRPTADSSLPAFFTDLYTQWDREPDLAVALQRAQLAWHTQAPGADWASFRLFEP